MGYAVRKADIKGSVFSVTANAIVDTGSDTTIINSEIARELESDGVGNLILVGPQGEPITGWYTFASLRILNTPYSARKKIVVVNKMTFQPDVLIGNDFLMYQKQISGKPSLEINCDKCGSPIDTCPCTWLPFKVPPQLQV